MRTLIIQPDDEQVTPGDLRARVSGDRLLLPSDFASAIRREGVRTALDLLSYMQTFPSAVASMLHWQTTEVSKAASLLQHQLAEHSDVLPPPRAIGRRVAFGALDPGLLDKPARKP